VVLRVPAQQFVVALKQPESSQPVRGAQGRAYAEEAPIRNQAGGFEPGASLISALTCRRLALARFAITAFVVSDLFGSRRRQSNARHSTWPSFAGPCAKEHRAPGDPGHELRIERPELDQEISCHQQRRQPKHNIAWQTHPLPHQRSAIEFDTARVGEPVFEDGVELRPADRKKVERDPQQQADVVEPECPPSWPLIESEAVAGGITKTEIYQADSE
jgi:hypothetical protein